MRPEVLILPSEGKALHVASSLLHSTAAEPIDIPYAAVLGVDERGAVLGATAKRRTD